MSLKKLALIVSSILSFSVSADVITHYKTKTFVAQTAKVVSPRMVEIQAYLTDDLTNLSKLYIHTEGLIYDEGDNEKCDQGLVTFNCQRLIDTLSEAKVQFRLGDAIGKSIFKGSMYVNGIELRHTMIRKGWYKFDYRKGRSHYDIILQKEAECKRVGIWSTESYEPTDLRCQ